MPRVTDGATAAAWAADRAISVWVIHVGDADRIGESALRGALAPILADGARLAVAAVDEREVPLAEVASWVEHGEPPPSPATILAIAVRSGVLDVRRLGVLAATPAAVEAAHRAGVGAIIGLRTDGVAPLSLSRAAPDVMVVVESLAEVDRLRYGSQRARRPLVLLNPGPSVTSDRIHRAVAGPDACHREPEIEALLGRLRAGLRRVAGVDATWAVVLLAGSGTAAMEAMIGAAVRPGRRLLVCSNGVYGERMVTIARRLGVRVAEVRAAHVDPIEPAAVEAALVHDPTIDAVAVVHHETTTGLLNPVHEIAAVAATRGIPVLVDAISSFGAEELRPGEGIDWVAGTANKCLHGLPGLAFVIASPRAVERGRNVPPRSLYLDLQTYLGAEARGTVPFTPAIPAAYALEAALEELEELEAGARPAEYHARMERLDAGLGALGLEPIVASAHRSSSIRCLPLPPGVEYAALHDALKARGYVIYAGLGEAARSTFRICALGELDAVAMDGVVATLSAALGPLAPMAARALRAEAASR